MTVSQSNAEGATLDAQEHPAPAYELVRRNPGRPSSKAPADGQLNLLTGEQVRHLPSAWEEPKPEPLTAFQEHPEATAEAAIESLTLDEELAPSREEWLEMQRRLRRARFSVHLTLWGSLFEVRNEQPSVKLALVAHLGTMEGLGWHDRPLASVGEPLGQSRATMSRASKRLLELGLLERIEHRGKDDEWRVTSRLLEAVERAEQPQRARSAHTQDPEPAPTDHPQAARSARAPARSPRATRALSAHVGIEEKRSTTRTEAENEAAPAACVDCGGAVKHWNGIPNPRCKPCHTAGKRSHQRSQPRAEGEPPPPPPVRGSGIGPDCNECGRDADTLDDRGHARWCSALEIEPKTPEMAPQDAHRALVSTSSDDEAVNRLNAARDALRASAGIEG